MGQVQYYAGHPLFHALGASRLDRTICVATAYAGWRATLGAVTGNDSEQMVGADLVVLWGINAAYSTINVMTLVKQARARGAYVVVIDPYRTPTAQQADEHLMVRPGTDGALALAMMHVLMRRGPASTTTTSRAPPSASIGWPSTSRAWTPARVAADRRPARGRRSSAFARRYGATPPLVRPHRHRPLAPRQRRHDVPDAGLPARAHRRLRRSRTAVRCSPPAAPSASTSRVLERPDLLPRPAPRVINMIQLGRALTDPALAPPVKALYVYSSNPAAVCPNQSLVLRGLAREDLFTVVHEQVMTDTARYADLVLPATTSMEHEDLYRSYGQFYLQLARAGGAAATARRAPTGRSARCSRARSAWPRRTTRRRRSR